MINLLNLRHTILDCMYDLLYTNFYEIMHGVLHVVTHMISDDYYIFFMHAYIYMLQSSDQLSDRKRSKFI